MSSNLRFLIGATAMHVLTIQTKFTFGDAVRFNSNSQHCEGTGIVFAITIDAAGQIDYIIELSRGIYSDLQPGILEHEITLLETDMGSA